MLEVLLWLHVPLTPLAGSLPLQVFDFERWKTHRSSSRYLRHVLGMRDSKIVSDLGS